MSSAVRTYATMKKSSVVVAVQWHGDSGRDHAPITQNAAPGSFGLVRNSTVGPNTSHTWCAVRPAPRRRKAASYAA